MSHTGVLLINIGTPDSSSAEAVSKYLGEFLMDPLVIDIPWVLRWPLVHGLIRPKRAANSAELYRQIWTKEGSPLLVHSKKFAEKLQEELGPNFRVALGMRYGNPSIETAWAELQSQNMGQLVVLPLYPQYSLAATQSALESFDTAAGKDWGARAQKIRSFYEDPGFIDAYAARIQESLRGFDFEHLVFSYHGLPKRQVKRTEKSPHCMRTYDCCEHIGDANQDCYRAQCYATTRALCWKLKVPVQKVTVSFQSRIGRGWIEPFTDRVLQELGSRKASRVAVVCPSFVTDCLETLEEIGIRETKMFREKGGGEIRVVPALNSDSLWVKAAAALVADALKR